MREAKAHAFQTELASTSNGSRVYVNDDIRQIMATVVQAPILTANFLAATGKIQATTTYHAIRATWDLENAVRAACYLRVDNIRMVLNRLSAPGNHNWKEQFRMHNPIPGARWNTEIQGQPFHLLNVAQIFPADYGIPELSRDVQDYNNLLSGISKRLPPAFIR